MSGIADVDNERKLVKAVSCDKCQFFKKQSSEKPPSLAKEMWLKIHNLGREQQDSGDGKNPKEPEVVSPEPPHKVERVAFNAPVRNLMFHAWPTKSGLWRTSVSDLVHRMDMFNGKRVLGIAVDENTEHPEEVINAFGGEFDETYVFENLGYGLAESESLKKMLASVNTDNDQHVTFYGHTKGSTYDVSSEFSRCSQLWGDVMRETCLDYWPLIQCILETKAAAGPFKKIGKIHAYGEWHYSGTHFWFRNRDVYLRNGLEAHENMASRTQLYNTEGWLSTIFFSYEVGTIFYDGTHPEMNLYSMPYWKGMVHPQFETWRMKNKRYCTSECRTDIRSFIS